MEKLTKTYNVKGAANYLNMPESSFRLIIPEIGGIKKGREWIFTEDELIGSIEKYGMRPDKGQKVNKFQNDKKYFTVEEAAEYIRIPLGTLRKHLPEIKRAKLGRLIIISLDSLEEWINSKSIL